MRASEPTRLTAQLELDGQVVGAAREVLTKGHCIDFTSPRDSAPCAVDTDWAHVTEETKAEGLSLPGHTC